jgi:hypothetical protein
VADLIKAAEQKLITPEEFRNIARKIGWEITEQKQELLCGLINFFV